MQQRYWLVVGTFALSLLLYIDRICISAAKADVTRDLQLSDTQFGWILSAFALGYALFQTPGGVMADKYGPRRILSAIVVFWSAFTALTGLATGYITMLIYRFLFGAGEAGAFPAISRAVYSWIPAQERGLVNGINFSGSRIGGAAALIIMPWFIQSFGWRESFFILGGVGVLWALFWWAWFRDTPEEKPHVSDQERALIAANRPAEETAETVPLGVMLKSRNMWIAMAQYLCSNFTFFFTLTWLYPFVQKTYDLSIATAGILAAMPLLGGALGNWVSGLLVDKLYRSGRWTGSRRIPAIIGFLLGAAGLIFGMGADSAVAAIFWLTIAVFGVDMTLSPSWSFCVDIGRKSSGAVSGTMNMAGNLGSFTTALAFPYLQLWTGNNQIFFVVAAALNIFAALLWLKAEPQKPITIAVARA
ncbi:MAG: MFS transporter [Sphingomonadales bacterium]|nr:MFS transporter [Sphingomonadales bacterium]